MVAGQKPQRRDARAAKPIGIERRAVIRLARVRGVRCGIGGVSARHDREQDRRVLDGSRHRPGRVLAVRDRDDERAGDEADRRLDADETVAADGQGTTDPSVSVPIAPAARLAAIAAPDPELDPHALRSSA